MLAGVLLTGMAAQLRGAVPEGTPMGSGAAGLRCAGGKGSSQGHILDMLPITTPVAAHTSSCSRTTAGEVSCPPMRFIVV